MDFNDMRPRKTHLSLPLAWSGQARQAQSDTTQSNDSSRSLSPTSACVLPAAKRWALGSGIKQYGCALSTTKSTLPTFGCALMAEDWTVPSDETTSVWLEHKSQADHQWQERLSALQVERIARVSALEQARLQQRRSEYEWRLASIQEEWIHQEKFVSQLEVAADLKRDVCSFLWGCKRLEALILAADTHASASEHRV